MDPPPLDQFIVDTTPAAPPPQAYTAPPPQAYTAPPPQQFYVAAMTPKRKRYPAASRRKTLTALLVVLLVVAVFYLCLVARRPSLAHALAARGWFLYTRPGCIYCSKQMNILEGAYPRQVVCSKKPGILEALGRIPYPCKNVTAFPFWVNERTMITHTGLQNRDQLRQMLESPGTS